MIVHVVMWRISDADGVAKAEKIATVKRLLETLPGLVPYVDVLRVGVNVVEGSTSSDVLLYTEFKDMQALQAYQNHPEHLRVAAELGPLFSERRMVDFERED